MIDFKAPLLQWPTTKSFVAFIVVGGYVLALGTIAIMPIPNDQLDILDKAMVGLGTLAGAIVNGLFQRRDTQ